MCTGRPERPSSGFATLPTQGSCQQLSTSNHQGSSTALLIRPSSPLGAICCQHSIVKDHLAPKSIFHCKCHICVFTKLTVSVIFIPCQSGSLAWTTWRSSPGSTQWIGNISGEHLSFELSFQHHGKIKQVFVINFNNSFASRDRPAAFPVNVTSIDDTKNFDEFPEVRFFYISQIRGLQIHLTWLQSHNFLNSWPQVQHFSWKCSILSGGARLLQGCTKQGWAEGGEGLSGWLDHRSHL